MPQLVWLVTGASSGIGAQFIHSILARGDKVIATARNLSKLQSSLVDVQQLDAETQARLSALELDITSKQFTIDSAIARAVEVFGRIDVLVNNASYIQIGTWEDLTYEDLISQFDTNVFGTMKVTKSLLPHFRQRKQGSMVFISSLSGWIGHAGCGAYAGSKFALEGLVESLHAETSPLGIRTLLIEPGRFRTNLLSPSNMRAAPSTIPEYSDLSNNLMGHLAAENQAQSGDPAKLVEIIVDLIRGEGVAEGKQVPFRIPMGSDCYEDIKQKCELTLQDLEQWRDIVTNTDFD